MRPKQFSERHTACKGCPFLRSCKIPHVPVVSFIKETLRTTKGNFMCHEDSHQPGRQKLTRQEPDAIQQNTCAGFQQMLAGRGQKKYIRNLKQAGKAPEQLTQIIKELL